MTRTALIFDDQELATVLAALRLFQRTDSEDTEQENDIATSGGTCSALGIEDIDSLCERINGTTAQQDGYALAITTPNTKREGLWNFVQMIINDMEAGDFYNGLLRAVDLRNDISCKSNPYKIPGTFHYPHKSQAGA